MKIEGSWKKSEAAWIIFGQIGTIVASIIMVRFLTEKLSPTDYGFFSLAMTLGVLIGQLAFASSMPGIQRYYSVAVEKKDTYKYLNDTKKLFGYGMVGSLVLGLILLTLLYVIGKNNILIITIFAIIYNIFSNINVTQSMIQNEARQRQNVALHNIMDAWLKIVFVFLIFDLLGNHTINIIFGFIASIVIVIISQTFFIRKLIPKTTSETQISNDWSKKIWIYSRPFLLFNLFTWLQSSADRWALEIFASTNEVGLYAVLIQLGLTPMTMFAGFMATLFGPILFQQSGDGMSENRNAKVSKDTWLLTFFTLIITIVGFFISMLVHEYLFAIMVSEQYRTISYLLPWMVMAGGIIAAGQIISLKILTAFNTSKMILPKTISSVLGVLLNFGGAYLYGIDGVVFGMVIYAWILFLWLCFVAHIYD